jgi:hypothetical protein
MYRTASTYLKHVLSLEITIINRKRRSNNDVSNRTSSKLGHIEQNVGNRTRSNLQAIRHSTNKGFFFSFYDTITFKGQDNLKIYIYSWDLLNVGCIIMPYYDLVPKLNLID